MHAFAYLSSYPAPMPPCFIPSIFTFILFDQSSHQAECIAEIVLTANTPQMWQIPATTVTSYYPAAGARWIYYIIQGVGCYKSHWLDKNIMIIKIFLVIGLRISFIFCLKKDWVEIAIFKLQLCLQQAWDQRDWIGREGANWLLASYGSKAFAAGTSLNKMSAHFNIWGLCTCAWVNLVQIKFKCVCWSNRRPERIMYLMKQ